MRSIALNLTEIEKKKRKYEGRVALGIIGFISVFFVIIANTDIAIYIFPIYFVFGLIHIKAYKDFKKLSILYKKSFIEIELQKAILDCIYDAEKGFPEDIVFNSKILQKKDRYLSEDHIQGEINGKTFESADIHIQQRRRSGKSTKLVTTFQGRFFIIDFKQNFKESVYIIPSRTSLLKTYEGMPRIDTESIIFNQKFDVYSKDNLSAFYLLNPRFMEKLLEFSKVAKEVSFGFIEQKMYVAVDTRKDAFDIKMFHPIDLTSFEDVQKEVDLLNELISLIKI